MKLANVVGLLIATISHVVCFRSIVTKVSVPLPISEVSIRKSTNYITGQRSSIMMTYSQTSEVPIKPSILQPLKDVWDFTRPHTIIGSSISIVSLYLYAVPRSSWKSSKLLQGLLAALCPSLLANIYITGLNQVTDIDIDKINKPYLPLASGRMKKSSGVAIVTLCGILATFLVRNSSMYLQFAVLGSILLGTVYSLPPFRLKRYPLLAAFCILVVRGSLINLGFFFDAKHTVLQQKLGSLTTILQNFPESLTVTAFFAVFGLVIALMKDVPDVSGDLNNNIRTFSVRLGSEAMFRISSKLLNGLLVIYSLLIGTSIFRSPFSSKLPFLFVSVVGLLFAHDVKRKAKLVNGNDPQKVFDYYMYTWNIFYACYLLLPFLGVQNALP